MIDKTWFAGEQWKREMREMRREKIKGLVGEVRGVASSFKTRPGPRRVDEEVRGAGRHLKPLRGRIIPERHVLPELDVENVPEPTRAEECASCNQFDSVFRGDEGLLRTTLFVHLQQKVCTRNDRQGRRKVGDQERPDNVQALHGAEV